MLVRWFILIVLVLFAALVRQAPLWPLAPGEDIFLTVLLGYAGLCVLLTIALFIPQLRGVFGPAYALDILAFSLAGFFSGEPNAILFPLYIFPLVGIALRYGTLTGTLFGIFATISYVVAAFGAGSALSGEEVATVAYMRLLLQGVVLISAPWVISTLVEQWSTNNTRRVTEARTDADQARQATELIRSQMQAIFTTATSLSSTLRGDQVLNALLREGQKLVPYTAGLALLPKHNPGELEVAAGHNLSLVDPGVTVKIVKGSIVARSLYPPATPQLIADISQQEDVQSLTTLHTCKAACLIPLVAGVDVYGLVLFARDTSTPFSQDELNMLVALTSYATVALINDDLGREVQQDRVNIATAEEHARHWLAREIHDGLAQKLAAITMNTDFIKRLIEEDPAMAVTELDKLGDIFKRANYDVRTLLGELKPTTLETKGLPAALEEYLERLRPYNEKVQFIFEAKGVSGMTLAKEAQGTLFNIVQESLNNALKYAEARHIWLKLERSGYRLQITIRDDGKGFNVEEGKARAKARGSYGLSNLSDRARLINGRTEIESEPGQGTTIRVHVPLEV
jgi:signal transduction histidine kinase